MRRFKSGAMKLRLDQQGGARTLAIAMNRNRRQVQHRRGRRSPERYNLEANGDSKNSAIKKVASGRFGA